MPKTRLNNMSAGETWASRWLDLVASGGRTMSQRKLESLMTKGGGINSVLKVARKRGVHLVVLTDDKGDQLVAASKRPFKILC